MYIDEKQRLQMLREGIAPTGSDLIKQINRRYRDKISFIRILDNKQIEYIHIENPKNNGKVF